MRAQNKPQLTIYFGLAGASVDNASVDDRALPVTRRDDLAPATPSANSTQRGPRPGQGRRILCQDFMPQPWTVGSALTDQAQHRRRQQLHFER